MKSKLERELELKINFLNSLIEIEKSGLGSPGIREEIRNQWIDVSVNLKYFN
ncbi:hypothetical protein [Evansella cellulosilytica]|uniref:Uncharacterized protein n=1 Tax=Evansella cellulosilytica (strain ATCC 21833 / DSM 2522 / FERM P-1141 / JCM 9156 / N-4) TaxID=649639 RepID=E6U1I5_EVAC2|nr:hypothetical protein [Evansella cellulosilytica]ADU30348.1 hypothetical protein Bcell_2087 [Evansella cellulosilytica DSM 2522]